MKRKVIIDCDPGIDDSLAIMLALSSPELDILGITITAGNAPLKQGFENAKKVLNHMNRLDVPIFLGADKPLVKEYVDALDTHGEDGLGESFLPEIEGYTQNINALEFYENTLSTTKCSVIALGPLTNLAHLVQKNTKAFDQIEEIISMGGSYKSHGNCSPVAEYNYWEDPEAAKIVYERLAKINKRIHMIGLDVTRKIVLTPTLLEFMERLNQKQGSFIRKITKFYFDFHWQWEHIIGCVINDPLAVAYFTDRSLCSGFNAYTDIETDGITRGQSVVDSYGYYRKKANARILTQVEAKNFFVFFLERILDCKKEDLDYLDKILGEENVW
ncbi:nucleoside hydrolase [Faecalitalea cylindroides]|uniref:nucleoside hydrolase n=1 Tax=Faecalitalea cylindroides TaxID=39483 RepID=UPI002490E93F|nr:nucleoside hydrolase [Faecalitalea cylindroides]